MRGIFEEAATRCSRYEGETMYDCLQNELGDQSNIRGVKEVLLRSFGIQIIALAAYGHLLSLQGITRSRLFPALLSVFFFFVFPEITIAQMLLRALRMGFRVFWRKERLGYRYCLSACLGVHATSSNRIASLTDLTPHDVDSDSCRVDFTWLGRLGLLLALLTQHAGSCVLWIRLVFVLKDRSYWHWHLDFRNFEVVLGGTMAVVNSLAILILNQGEWRLRRDSGPLEYVEEFQIAEENKEGVPSDTMSRLSFLSNLRKNDLELGVVLHRILVHVVVVYTFIRFSGACPPILEVISEGRYTSICPDHVNVLDPMTFSLIPSIRKLTRLAPWLVIPSILFNIAISRICVKWVFQALSLVTSSFHLEFRFGEILSNLKKWMFSGRSIVSFPSVILLFILVPFWSTVMIELCLHYHNVEAAFRNGHMEGGDRLAIGVLMWKDPWYDNLYIL